MLASSVSLSSSEHRVAAWSFSLPGLLVDPAQLSVVCVIPCKFELPALLPRSCAYAEEDAERLRCGRRGSVTGCTALLRTCAVVC